MAPSTTKPDHSTHGETRATRHNIWTKDTKTKTCRCRVCGQKVDLWSWHCNRCNKTICSKCCEDDPSGADYNKQRANDQMQKGCNCMRFTTDFNPALAKLKSKLPPKQEEQRARDAAAKQKAIKTGERKRAAAAADDDPREGPSKQPVKRKASAGESSSELSDELSDSEIDFMAPDAAPSLLGTKTPRTQRRTYAELESEEDEEVPEADVDGGEYEEEPDISAIAQIKRDMKGKAPSRASNSNTAAPPPNFDLPTGFVNPLNTKNKKRKSDAAQLEPDETQATPARKTKKSKKSSPLEDDRTVIVGAGIIGLFTAYELATQCVKDETSHSIIVVEIRNGVCQLASGQCAGFLTSRGIPKNKGWVPILFDAQKGWQDLMREAKVDGIGLIEDERTCFAEAVGDVDDEGVELPGWFKPSPIHYASEDDKLIGRIDTKLVVNWLYQQCREMGVDFRFGQALEAVQRSRDGTEYRVRIGDPQRPSEKRTALLCDNIIISAGPFTTHIVKHIFNDGEKTGLGNGFQQHLWIDVPISPAPTQDELKRRVSEAGITVATTDRWSAGSMAMVVRPGMPSIEISAAEKVVTSANISPSDALNVPAVQTGLLEGLAADYLGIRRGGTLQVSSGGAHVISEAKGSQPYIGQLRMRSGGGSDVVERPNVWLSYGFGRFGTTLAPGAARTLVKKMLGE